MSLQVCRALWPGGNGQRLRLPALLLPTVMLVGKIEMSGLLLNPTTILLEVDIRKQAWRCGPEIPATQEAGVGGL